ncbi:sensor histidine kinase [Micromonospora sp. DT229]|uniref:sensor histidine kinase n=1 Tax=Micromonospora sp. DT229 TaxID=3393430 RepID=UPI003CFB6ADC
MASARRSTGLPRLAGVGGSVLGVVAMVAGTAMVAPDGAERGADLVAWFLVGCAGVAAVAVWWWPVPAGVLVTVALLGYVGGNFPDGPVLLAGLMVLFALGGARSRWVGYGFAAGMSLVVLVAGAVVDGGPGVVDLAFVGWCAAAVFAADALTGVRERRAGRRERARLRAEARRRETDRRLAEQRLRIARDLHDSVAHAMATINVQAGMAGRVIDSRPEVAREALEVVRAVSATVLDELNAMVRVLRSGEEGAPFGPAPGLSDLPELVCSARQSGTAVRLDFAVPPGRVPGPAQLAAYRIVQESLTNVARYASGASARVAVSYAEEAGLRVVVEDTGSDSPRPVPGGGVGIAGMRERAVATGGSLVAGPTPTGGFRVTAEWPSGRTASPERSEQCAEGFG